MKEIRIEKITLNIGTGKPGPDLDKAVKLLEIISGCKPVETKTTKRIPTWGVRPGLAIGAKVTLRGKKAKEVLQGLLTANDHILSERKFDKEGNFAFGLKEYLDIPGIKYQMDIGIIGLEVSVTLERPGFRIKKRMIKTKKIPPRHRITKKEAIEFAKTKLGVKIKEEEEAEE